jgi:hypothetical protein
MVLLKQENLLEDNGRVAARPLAFRSSTDVPRFSSARSVDSHRDAPFNATVPSTSSGLEEQARNMLPSNAGWRGKTVHSWMCGDQQEDVQDGKPVLPTHLITVFATSSRVGENVVCTNMAGKEVVVVNRSLQEVTFGQIYDAIEQACSCQANDVQLITVEGQRLYGLNSWTLAEAKRC